METTFNDLVQQERQRANEKYPHNKDLSKFQWFCVLAEEVGELVDALDGLNDLSSNNGEVRLEAVQVAAMCAAMAEYALGRQLPLNKVCMRGIASYLGEVARYLMEENDGEAASFLSRVYLLAREAYLETF